MARKQGSLGGEMRIRVNAHCAGQSNKTKRNYKRACEKFDAWRKGEGISNREQACFENVGPDEKLFPHIDRDLDLHGIRAERAREAYEYYAKICATPEGREEIRRQLWERYLDPEVGCKSYNYARAAGNSLRMQYLRDTFAGEMAGGTYYLRSANRRVATERGRPIAYNRLALCCVSVFTLSHWRNEVTVKHYML